MDYHRYDHLIVFDKQSTSPLVFDDENLAQMLANCHTHIAAFNSPFTPTMFAMAQKLAMELSNLDISKNVSITNFILNTLIFHAIKYKYYSDPAWENQKETLFYYSLLHTKIIFSSQNPHNGNEAYLATGDAEFLKDKISPLGLRVVNYFNRYSFETEIARIESFKAEEDNTQRLKLPFNDIHKIATITNKDYVGMLSGNITSRRRIVALTDENLLKLKIDNYKPYLNGDGNYLVLRDFMSRELTAYDPTILRIIYTELLELYRQASPKQREAYKNGAAIAFNPKKMLRKMTQNTKNYNLFAKLLEYNNLFSIKIVDLVAKEISLSKVLTVESYSDTIFKITASTLMEMISEVECENMFNNHAFYLPMGGKKGSLSVKIVTEHVIAQLVNAGFNDGNKPQKVAVNLWRIFRQYPQVEATYEGHTLTRNKNVWLGRLVNGVYKTLQENVAPHYRDFVITPEIVNSKTQKQINIPTSTTLKGHVINISHKGIVNTTIQN